MAEKIVQPKPLPAENSIDVEEINNYSTRKDRKIIESVKAIIIKLNTLSKLLNNWTVSEVVIFCQ